MAWSGYLKTRTWLLFTHTIPRSSIGRSNQMTFHPEIGWNGSQLVEPRPELHTLSSQRAAAPPRASRAASCSACSTRRRASSRQIGQRLSRSSLRTYLRYGQSVARYWGTFRSARARPSHFASGPDLVQQEYFVMIVVHMLKKLGGNQPPRWRDTTQGGTYILWKL